MNKLKSFVFSEKKLSKAIFGFLVIAALAFTFGPNVYAQFARQTGNAGWGYGYGYGYGYGVGTNDGGYRTGGGDSDQYEYDFGYGFIDTYTWSQGGFGDCTLSCGGGTQTQTVVCKNSSSVTVDDALCTTTKPATSQSCNTQSCGSGGGGGTVNTAMCTDVTYGDYTAACFGTYNFRAVLTRTPANCTLTAAQQAATQRACAADALIISVNGNQPIPTIGDQNSARFIALEKSLVKKINKALAKRLSGRILLQVQERGQAWYVYPVDQLKYFMGTPSDAFALMRKMALGISNKDFASYKNNTAPARLSGRILLKVEDKGMAYYVNPVNLKMYYLGRPADAFSIMRSLGLGITNADLRQIGIK